MSDAPAAEETEPFEEQRRIYKLLSQETRHLILQFILGHPAHLPSLDELDYMIPKNKAAIRDQLQVLAEAQLITRYEHPPNEESRDLPSQFYGLTEYGVEVLHEYNYLRGLPIARAVYHSTRLSEKAERHREAPRPELPPAVEEALKIEDTESIDDDPIAQYVREHKSNTQSVDDQIAAVRWFYDAGIGPDHDGIKRSELGGQLAAEIDYRSRTILDHLVDIDLLEERAPPGPDVFAISERLDEIVNGRETDEAEANIEALIAHIDDELQSVELGEDAAEVDGSPVSGSAPSVAMADGAGRTIRSILADTLPVDPEGVIDYLRSGDPVDRLNEAMDVIESSDEVSTSEEYGRIVFVRPAYRYRLTNRVVEFF